MTDDNQETSIRKQPIRRRPWIAISISIATAIGLASAVSPTEAQQSFLRVAGENANDFPRGEACRSKIAIDVTFGHLCTEKCSVDTQCPSDWKCKSIRQGNGRKVGLCFPMRSQRRTRGYDHRGRNRNR